MDTTILDDNKKIWDKVLLDMELSVSKANFSTWFKDTTIISNNKGRILIGVPNGFAKEWLENKFNSYIIRALRNFQSDIKELSCAIYSQNPENKPRNIDAIKAPIKPKPNFSKESLPEPQLKTS